MPGKRLVTRPAFFDVTDGLPVDAIEAQLRAWRDEGVSAVCVAEAFAPDDTTQRDGGHRDGGLARACRRAPRPT